MILNSTVFGDVTAFSLAQKFIDVSAEYTASIFRVELSLTWHSKFVREVGEPPRHQIPRIKCYLSLYIFNIHIYVRLQERLLVGLKVSETKGRKHSTNSICCLIFLEFNFCLLFSSQIFRAFTYKKNVLAMIICWILMVSYKRVDQLSFRWLYF